MVDREPRDHELLGGRPARELLAVLVADVHRGSVGEQRCEEARLALEVRIERPVIVEVVVREVRETRRGVVRSVDAVLVERVRRHLHRHRADPRVAHRGEHHLEIGGLGRGVRVRQRLVADAGADRADHTGDVAGRGRDRLQQIGGGGLAVGTGHAEGAHREARFPLEPRRERTQHASHGRDPCLGDVDRQPLLHEQRDRAGADRLGRVAMPVRYGAANATEQRTGFRRSAVRHDARDVDGGDTAGGRVRPDPGLQHARAVEPREISEEVVQVHAASLSAL